MNDRNTLRLGAVAAVGGAVALVASGLVLPDSSGEPADAVAVVSESGVWIGARLAELAGILLAVFALAVFATALTGGAKHVARAGLPLLGLAGALGTAEVAISLTAKHLAERWADAAHGAREPLLAAFDAANGSARYLNLVTGIALALYLATLAAGIMSSGAYPRWLGWTAAAGAALDLTGELGGLRVQEAAVVELAGSLLLACLLIALGARMWREAARGLRETPEWAGTAALPARINAVKEES